MRPGTLLSSLLIAIALSSALGCGGSSSETPWPREPEGPDLGPAGESAPASAPVEAPAEPTERIDDAEGDEPSAPR